MYKAQAESQQADANTPPSGADSKADSKGGDDVQDVDFEEVKDW